MAFLPKWIESGGPRRQALIEEVHKRDPAAATLMRRAI